MITIINLNGLQRCGEIQNDFILNNNFEIADTVSIANFTDTDFAQNGVSIASAIYGVADVINKFKNAFVVNYV